MKYFKMTSNLFGNEKVVAAGFRFPDGTTVCIGAHEKAGTIICKEEDFEEATGILDKIRISVEWFE